MDRIFLFESYIKSGHKDIIVFHGTGHDFEVSDFKTNDIGFHFGSIRHAWNFANSRMTDKHRYSREQGLLYGLDYSEIIKSYKLSGNFMDFMDLDEWRIKNFISSFDDLVEWSGDTSMAYNTSLTPYDNLNRHEIKVFCGADDPDSDLDGLVYINEYDSDSITRGEEKTITAMLIDRGFTKQEIDFVMSVKDHVSYLVFNKSSIIPYKN
jgi:hypothetical protein